METAMKVNAAKFNKIKTILSRYYEYSVKTKLQSINRASELFLMHDNLHSIKKGDMLCVVVFRNEQVRLPFFMDYYRKMGIKHFLMIDNQSTDNAMAYLRNFKDCSVWAANGSYGKSHCGLDWVNYLLNRFCCDHWTLHVDPDEFLVYPYMDTRTLGDLTTHLEGMNKFSFNTILVDCYGNKAIGDILYNEGDNPLDHCPYFDNYGYLSTSKWHLGEYCVGGVRRRLFSDETCCDINLLPALNKTPLVKWRKNYRYISSTHILYPRSLNRVRLYDEIYTTGCLLHFKFIDKFLEKVDEEIIRGEHWDNSREYRRYKQIFQSKHNHSLWNEASVKYDGWRTLINAKLMGTGNWF
jgi:hypothetical protein